jgi:hypothetical protein
MKSSKLSGVTVRVRLKPSRPVSSIQRSAARPPVRRADQGDVAAAQGVLLQQARRVQALSCNWRVADWMALPWRTDRLVQPVGAKSMPVDAAKCATPASALA